MNKKFFSIFIVPFLSLAVFSGMSATKESEDFKFEPGAVEYKPAIVWSPERIEQDVFPGTTKIISATFTSKKDLENVKFWLTPRLNRYTTTEPESIEKVEANKEYPIYIVVSLPSDILKSYSENHPDKEIEDLDRELKSYLNKDFKEHLKFFKHKIPGLLFVTSEKTFPFYSRFLRKEHKFRVIHPEPLKIMIGIKEPTAEEIPIDEVSLPTPERIYEDEETGAIYVRDEVLIGFKEDTPESVIKDIVSDIGGIFLGSILDLDAYQVQIPTIIDPDQLKTTIQQLKTQPEVKIATYSWINVAR